MKDTRKEGSNGSKEARKPGNKEGSNGSKEARRKDTRMQGREKGRRK